MSNADAAWLHMDQPTNPMVVNSVFLFDEPLDLGALAATFEERIVDEFPRFRQRVAEQTLGRPRFEDDPDFHLDQHVHVRALPTPGDTAALRELVGELITGPLDFSRPLWHIYLIEGHGDGCAVLVRIHHCIADGIALSRVMLLLTDEESGPGIAPLAPASRRDRLPFGSLLRPVAGALSLVRGAASLAVHEGMEVLADPGHVGRLAGRAARGTGTLAKLLTTPADSRTVLKGRLHGTRRVAWSDPFPLERVKRAAHRADATINDVLVAALAGALRRYLEHQEGGAPDDEVHVMVPFNLRRLDQPVPRELGNDFAMIVLALPTGTADPSARLRQVKARMAQVKTSDEGPIAYGILSGFGLMPAAVEERLIGFFTDKASAIVTNVPGPREPVYLAGVAVRAVLVWGPCSGSIGMSVSIFSYAGEVTVGLMTDIGLVPDPEPLVKAFDAELRTLCRGTRSSSRAARPRAERRQRL
jgi:diacylglycerol O-acyltransferase / wax synthase